MIITFITIDQAHIYALDFNQNFFENINKKQKLAKKNNMFIGITHWI